MFVNLRVVDGSFLSTLSLRRATMHALKLANTMLFLSTLSLRRATQGADSWHKMISISIHALLAESDGSGKRSTSKESNISIHALLAESDVTSVARVATTVISIHALLAESDNVYGGAFLCIAYFYPRSPCGERH